MINENNSEIIKDINEQSTIVKRNNNRWQLILSLARCEISDAKNW